MALNSIIYFTGNLATDVELRFTPNGKAVANFQVAQTNRKFDRTTNQWVDDGDPNFYRCSVWSRTAENAAESLVKGSPVIVIGRLKSEKYIDRKSGEKRTSYNNVEVDAIGPDLTYVSGQLNRPPRSNGGGQNYGNQNSQQGGQNYGNQGGYGNQNQGSDGYDSWDNGTSEPPF